MEDNHTIGCNETLKSVKAAMADGPAIISYGGKYRGNIFIHQLWAAVGSHGQLWRYKAPLDCYRELWAAMGSYGQLWAAIGSYGQLLAAMSSFWQLWEDVEMS